MSSKDQKDEKELRAAVKHVKKEDSPQRGGAKKQAVDPEDEPVTEETRKQAKHDLQAAIQRLKKEEKSKQ